MADNKCQFTYECYFVAWRKYKWKLSLMTITLLGRTVFRTKIKMSFGLFIFSLIAFIMPLCLTMSLKLYFDVKAETAAQQQQIMNTILLFGPDKKYCSNWAVDIRNKGTINFALALTISSKTIYFVELKSSIFLTVVLKLKPKKDFSKKFSIYKWNAIYSA